MIKKITLKNKTTQKFISLLIIFSMFMPTLILFSKPQKAEAFWGGFIADIFAPFTAASTQGGTVAGVANTAVSVRNVAKEIYKQVVMTITRRLLQEMTKSTVNWINTGNWGNPLFVENPKSFFKDIAKYEIKLMVDLFGYDSKKYPFGKSFALNIINSYKRTLADNAEYTLSRAITDPVLLKGYQNDFNVGGWNGFLVNTQYPQNNYIGFQMLATEALARKLDGTVQTNVEKVKTKLDQGMGFLSPQTCPDNGGNNAYNQVIANQFKRPVFKSTTPVPRPGPGDYAGINASNGVAAITFEGTTPASPFKPIPGLFGGTTPASPIGVGVRRPINFENTTGVGVYIPEFQEKLENYQIEAAAERGAWNITNECKGGLVDTTPGSVVANQAMRAMSSTFAQTELGAALGNSMSAILDAFLQKFLNKGLNALASKVTPSSKEDTWDYYGNTLGSASTGGTNVAWNSGPDEEIVVSGFKEAVDDGIKGTTTELGLISQIEKSMGETWPKTRELDMCIPGPNLGWQDRLEKEYERNNIKLLGKTNESDGNKAAAATSATRELEFAVKFFKNWIEDRMMTELPSSLNYIEAVDELRGLDQESNELTNRKRLKSQALARLNSIRIALSNITSQPAPGSAQEKTLIQLKRQYDTVRIDISNNVTISEAQNQLSVLKERITKLDKLNLECKAERTSVGWSNPGGKSSNFTGVTGTSCTESSNITVIKPLPATMNTATEYEIKIRVANNGESYWYKGDAFQFVRKSGNLDIDPLLGELPYPVSANRANPSERYVDYTIPIVTPAIPGNYSLAAQLVHRKGNPYIRLIDDTLDPRTTDTCLNSKKTATTDVFFGDVLNITISVPNTGKNEVRNLSTVVTADPDGNGGGLNATQSGTEQHLFCDAPIKGGYDHEGFRQSTAGARGNVTHPEIPLVNAKDVLKWSRWGWGTGDYTASIKLNCNIIYKSTVLDYKKNLPGLTGIVETYEANNIEDGNEGGDSSGGGSGICNGPGTADYAEDLASAMNTVNQTNPNGIASALNTWDNSSAYLNEVALVLRSSGFNATTNVKNGNDNPNRGDLIAIWKQGDTGMERYDAIESGGATPGGDGSGPLRNKGQTDYTGDIPLTCGN